MAAPLELPLPPATSADRRVPSLHLQSTVSSPRPPPVPQTVDCASSAIHSSLHLRTESPRSTAPSSSSSARLPHSFVPPTPPSRAPIPLSSSRLKLSSPLPRFLMADQSRGIGRRSTACSSLRPPLTAALPELRHGHLHRCLEPRPYPCCL